MADRRFASAAVTGGGGSVRGRATGVVLLVALALLPACAVQRAARGVEGADLATLQPGATRAEIESRLGPPLRQWTTSAGITYRVYRYDPGVPGSPSGAMALVFGEIATLGLLELIMKAEPSPPGAPRSQWRQVAVAYAADEVVLGVFIDVDDFMVLPDDGRPRGPVAPAVPGR